MKKIIMFFCFLASISVATAQQKELIDKLVATVGDEYVLLSEVEEQFSAAFDQRNGQIPENARCIFLDQILVNKLLLNQAKIDSVLVNDIEVETQLASRFERILEYMQGNVDAFIEYYHQTPDQMKEQMRGDMRDQMTAEKMRNKILEGITVTPSEVKKFFNDIPRDSLPYFNQEVEIAEIVFQPKANEVEREKARAQLTELREQIIAGKLDFAAVAKKYSQDPGSGREGGDLGWAKRGKYVTEFEAAAYKLDENEISEVIESEFGFHVLQLLGRKGNSVHVRHILIKPEITDEDYELAYNRLDSISQAIMRDSISFSAAVKRFGDKNTQSYHNDGRMTNPQSGTNTFETRELDPDTYFVIDTMKVGRVSRPIEIVSQTGEKHYRLVKLISKSSPHKADLQQDYNKIQTAAIEAKKNDVLVKWIEKTAKSTFIEIDPMYKDCSNLEKWQSTKKVNK